MGTQIARLEPACVIIESIELALACCPRFDRIRIGRCWQTAWSAGMPGCTPILAEIDTGVYSYAADRNSHHSQDIRVGGADGNNGNHHRIQHAVWLRPGMPTISAGEHAKMRSQIEHYGKHYHSYGENMRSRAGEAAT